MRDSLIMTWMPLKPPCRVPAAHAAAAAPPLPPPSLLAGVLAQGPQLPEPLVFGSVADWATTTNHSRTLELAGVRAQLLQPTACWHQPPLPPLVLQVVSGPAGMRTICTQILPQILAPELAAAWEDPNYTATLFAISGEHGAERRQRCSAHNPSLAPAAQRPVLSLPLAAVNLPWIILLRLQPPPHCVTASLQRSACMQAAGNQSEDRRAASPPLC